MAGLLPGPSVPRSDWDDRVARVERWVFVFAFALANVWALHILGPIRLAQIGEIGFLAGSAAVGLVASLLMARRARRRAIRRSSLSRNDA